MGDRAKAVLCVDLDAIAANWRAIEARIRPSARAAGVVKADAYGLGAEKVVPTLSAAGCRRFFVATLGEGAALRPLAPGAEFFVLSGPLPGEEEEFVRHGLTPVLNSPEQIGRWARRARGAPSAIHVDTGMSRLGLSEAEWIAFCENKETQTAVAPLLVMSHLAIADDPDHPSNCEQLRRFEARRHRLPKLEASIAASSGTFLGKAFHYQWVRPGSALYGINPTPGKPNPMKPVVRFSAEILQLRDLEPGDAVGYGATWRAASKGKAAVAAVGYADGLPRKAGNRAMGVLAGKKVPLIGRVSMDLAIFDVSAVSGGAHVGAMIDLISDEHDVDALADEAETIGYEILTSLGARRRRVYKGGSEAGGS
ncbi:alanine racemase [Alphaproteobacteria bacterium]|nr:alanine racemase [Alphaproteobacteria bacterium]